MKTYSSSTKKVVSYTKNYVVAAAADDDYIYF
jgi:hypothetical protein